MRSTQYSETVLCACGCGQFARLHGKFHSDQCCARRWNKRRKFMTVYVAPEPKQMTLTLIGRPDDGPRCSVCQKSLYNYEVEWGKCLPHKHGGMIRARTTAPSLLTAGD